MYCNYCGNDIGDEAICPNCKRQAVNDVLLTDATFYDFEKKLSDTPNIFLLILAFFIPLFGFIYYLTKIRFFQVKARAYGISALCGVATTVIISVLTALMTI